MGFRIKCRSFNILPAKCTQCGAKSNRGKRDDKIDRGIYEYYGREYKEAATVVS